MNARKRALLKYGSYGAVALVCAMMAALGSLKGFPLLAGPLPQVFLLGVAVPMILQGIANLRTKRQDCFIVRREELLGSSFILFVGAALFLILMLASCRPATTKPLAHQIFNFYGTESTGYWNMFGADVPGSFAAQEMPWRMQKSNQTACRRMRSCRLAALGSQSLHCSPRAGECSPGGTNRCPEQATIVKEQNEKDF